MEKNLSYFLLGNIEMAKLTTEQLIDITQDNEFKSMLVDDLKEYDAFYSRLMIEKSAKDEVKEINPFVKMSTNMTIGAKTLLDKSNANLSDMLCDGFGMGIKDATENIKRAKQVNERKEMISLAEDYKQLLIDNVAKYAKFRTF